LAFEIAGIILPRDTFRSHLNSQRQTIYDDLERINFQKAGETLAEVWSEAVINTSVIAERKWVLNLSDAEMPTQE